MRKLRSRPIIPLPDLYWISPEQLRLALGRSSYVWRKVDLPVFLDYFPPIALGTDLPADYRWTIDQIAEEYPSLVTHLALNTTWLHRFRHGQREATAAYVASKQSREVLAA
jgi:hypothetical protein